MTHFLSQEVSNYIKDKYNINLDEDNNISVKNYNPHICQARVWKSHPDYIPTAGGFTNYQCNHPKYNGCEFCEVHQKKYIDNELTLGKISEEPPETPFIVDHLGYHNKLFWIHQSNGMMNDDIIRYENDTKIKNYKAKKSRGRPPTKKIPYNDINWNSIIKDKNLHSLPLPSLKEYASKNNIYIYGKKSELINRIYSSI